MAANRKRVSPDDKPIPVLPVEDEEAPLSSIEQASEDDDDEEDEILDEEDGVVNAPVATQLDPEDLEEAEDDEDEDDDEDDEKA